MSRLFTAIGVVIAVVLLGCWCVFEAVMTDLALDYPTRLAGIALGYPASGTVAFYWGCTWAVLSKWVAMFFPYTAGALACAYTLLELLGRPVTSYAVSRWLGLTVTILCILPLISIGFSETIDFERLIIHTGWPAVFVFLYRPLWRHSIIILGSWAGCVITAMGVDHAPPFVAIGLSLTALNCYTIYRHS